MAATIVGLERLRRKLRKIPVAVRKEASMAIAEGAEQIAGGARARVPVDSGELAGSIKVHLGDDGMSAVVEAAAEHAKFVEFGTRQTPARPFLLPAFEEAKPKIVAEIKEAVRRALKDAAKG